MMNFFMFVVSLGLLLLFPPSHGQLFNLFGLTVTANKLPSFGSSSHYHHGCPRHGHHNHPYKNGLKQGFRPGHHKSNSHDDILAYLLEDDFKHYSKKKKGKKKIITIEKSHKDDHHVMLDGLEHQKHSPSANFYNDDDFEGSSYRSPSDLRHWLGEDFFYIRK